MRFYVLIFDLYEFHPTEQQLVYDMLQYGVGFFEWSKRQIEGHKDRYPSSGQIWNSCIPMQLCLHALCRRCYMLRIRD